VLYVVPAALAGVCFAVSLWQLHLLVQYVVQLYSNNLPHSCRLTGIDFGCMRNVPVRDSPVLVRTKFLFSVASERLKKRAGSLPATSISSEF
jgi:hypothetical protein